MKSFTLSIPLLFFTTFIHPATHHLKVPPKIPQKPPKSVSTITFQTRHKGLSKIVTELQKCLDELGEAQTLMGALNSSISDLLGKNQEQKEAKEHKDTISSWWFKPYHKKKTVRATKQLNVVLKSLKTTQKTFDIVYHEIQEYAQKRCSSPKNSTNLLVVRAHEIRNRLDLIVEDNTYILNAMKKIYTIIGTLDHLAKHGGAVKTWKKEGELSRSGHFGLAAILTSLQELFDSLQQVQNHLVSMNDILENVVNGEADEQAKKAIKKLKRNINFDDWKKQTEEQEKRKD